MVAWWTGGAWVLYFADAPTLVKDLATFQAPLIAYVFIGLLDLHHLYARRLDARAGLRLHVPVAAHSGGADRRIRAQRHLSLRSRRAARVGEEGGGAARSTGSRPATASIVCNACMSARPASISAAAPISAASSAALCIDACDAVMAKIGRPTRLIAYDTDINIKRRQQGEQPIYRIVRSAHGALCRHHRRGRRADGLHAWRRGSNDGVSVIHDRNPLFVRLSDGSVRNAYTVRILNKSLEHEDFVLSVAGLARRRHRRDRQLRLVRAAIR